jgi:molybdenum cofactor cytidylyltransferase
MTWTGTDGKAAHGAARVAAVVLAAGRSSRMGTSKALLPVGGVTAMERVVCSLRMAGAEQVVVVTGHDADALLPVLRRLQVDRAHNPDYDSGMFSSVQAGVAALRGDADAFFVLPVDVPLVTPRALRLVRDRFERGGKGIVYPVCCGRPGHPPLLSARYVPALLRADRSASLQAFLRAFPEDEAGADVRDLTVLMDMDAPEEHRILDRFAGILDGAGVYGPCADDQRPRGEEPQRQPNNEPSLTAEEALFILTAAGTPVNVMEHCRAVAVVGERLAEALKPHIPTLDVALVRAGCLLHDMARLLPNHAALAQEVLTNLGLPRLGEVVGQHMVMTRERVGTRGVTEAELVYLADKLVAKDELVGLDEREARAFRKMGSRPEAAERIRARTRDARAIAEKVAVTLSRPFDEVLSSDALGLGGSPDLGAATLELSVFLVRHAEPVGPGGKRFLGQADPGLGVLGEEQAKRLADELLAATGGACFDAVYCSDLRRAVRTAEIVAGNCEAAVQTERWLREIDVGLWEGLSWEEARQDYPIEYMERERDLVGQPFPEGESFKDLRARVVPSFVRLIEDNLAAGHRRVLVVGHKGTNRVILAHFLGLPLEDLFSIEQDFCALTVLQVSTDAAGKRRVAVGGSSPGQSA